MHGEDVRGRVTNSVRVKGKNSEMLPVKNEPKQGEACPQFYSI